MIELPYIEKGDATGVPVVMLHGVTDSWRSFEHVMPHLPDDIRAIAVTQRGHADAAQPESGYLIEDLAGDVVDLLDELGIERAVILGHSTGSWVTQRVAIDHPKRVIGVVLAGSFSGRPGDDPAMRELAAEMGSLRDPITDKVSRDFQESTVASPLPPGQMDAFVAESMKVPARVWNQTFTGFLEIDHVDGLAQLAAPALLIWGEKDAFIPRETQDELLGLLPDARLEVYEGVGHAVHWERPERFARDAAAFSRYSAGLQLSR
jgi:pimeloyl-ACP methyl ester carboxylesterase